MKHNVVKLLLVCYLCCGTVCVVAESVYVADHGSGVFSFDVISNELIFRDRVSVTVVW